MHSDNVVVALQPIGTGRSFREYDHDKTQDTSSCRLVLPFDSEYSFLIKVTDDVRRRVVVTIDGQDAFDLIVDKGTSVIERFQDSDKRFKFVRADNPAVSDPTSSYNGKICVKVCREVPHYMTKMLEHLWREPRVYRGPSNPYDGMGTWIGDPLPWHHGMNHLSSQDYVGGLTLGASAMFCSTDSTPRGIEKCAGEIGATVEGSKSDQVFGSTAWRGDDKPYSFFNFIVRGKETKAGYCSECGEKLALNAKFCSHCGTRV
jgi:hypothetical protein